MASVSFATGPDLTVSGKHVPHQVFLSKSTRVEYLVKPLNANLKPHLARQR